MPFFLLPESENRIEKSCFYQDSWLFENMQVFNFCTKNTNVSQIMGTWEPIGIFFHWYIFSKALMVHTTLPNFLFLAYLCPEIWAAGKNDPLDLSGP